MTRYTAQLFKYAWEMALDKMHRICIALWKTGEWPEDWMNSIFVPISKKGDLGQCKNYRTIALVAHASKIRLRIILERTREKTESEINDEQAGLRRGRGTRDQITNLRILMQKLKEHQPPLYMCFVHFTKRLTTYNEQLWAAMTEMGYPAHKFILLTKLYGKQQARVRVAGGLSNEFRVKKGVRQGCVISPYLYNIMAEVVMREVMDGWEGGVHIGGRRLTNLRYADDIVLLAESEEELQKIVNRLDQVGSEKGLLINMDETKVMTLNGKI